ncbi:hypothetical protein Pcal_1301 [Pyrobaculum calidifontis JCM 11548]|uniref:Uncharacterized protein n=1 Tax=Pyrobaculum calidifontis (strain DSM 21063 / JCM 11548 / VA1) TaxID=410359 RepID=A3MVQ8_PYRCJ|nr:hypothetical protein Pcal_1301 [Pyrobaculum calidifontis JCM 11548]
MVSPGGWLVVFDEVFFLDAVPLPGARAVDLGGGGGPLPVSLVGVRRVSEARGGLRLEAPLLGRWYVARLAPAREARGALGGAAHVLEVECDVCDLSLLLALMSPSHYPAYAARVFRAVAWAREARRAKTWEELVRARVEDFTRLMAGAFDALSNPKCLKTFWALAYDKSPRVREAAVKCGFWKPAEEGGGFTVLGALAYLPVAHLLPPQCNYLPPGFECL